ncbi:hypothetical protein DFS34DRAFT_697165 [Phlyctochytrium arcticum]|nr:hypothetical protein DFS34DRAFT_697165 [Phlyctochytrium arcticum]
MIQTVKAILKPYLHYSGNNWVRLLPFVEFNINNTRNSTGFTPFEIDGVYIPNVPLPYLPTTYLPLKRPLEKKDTIDDAESKAENQEPTLSMQLVQGSPSPMPNPTILPALSTTDKSKADASPPSQPRRAPHRAPPDPTPPTNSPPPTNPPPDPLPSTASANIAVLDFVKKCDRSHTRVIVRGTYLDAPVVFKIVDETKHSDQAAALDREVHHYLVNTPNQRTTKLSDLCVWTMSLQGHAIPRVIAYVRVWGMLRILVLEDCGEKVETVIQQPNANVEEPRAACFNCLTLVQGEGVTHQDARLANFVVSSNGDVRILDFELAEPTTPDKEEADRRTLLFVLFLLGRKMDKKPRF